MSAAHVKGTGEHAHGGPPKVMYAVSEGHYSDYSVRCVCASKELAEQIARDINADDEHRWEEARVEELPYFDSPPTKVPFITMMETLWDDGTSGGGGERIRQEWPHGWEAPMPRAAWRWVRAPVHNNRGGRLEVRGTDIERCRKVFSDKRRAIRAVDALREQREATGGS